MKIGDLVRVKEEHWADRSEIGVIVQALFEESKTNKGKAWRIMFPNGRIKPKLTKQLEIVYEGR